MTKLLIKTTDIGGETVKENDTYVVKDNSVLKSLILSSTKLNNGKHTTGHRHPGQEEIYVFLEGCATMELDDEKFPVGPGDVVLIPDGSFHRVYADRGSDSYFICVFNGSRNHK